MGERKEGVGGERGRRGGCGVGGEEKRVERGGREERGGGRERERETGV